MMLISVKIIGYRGVNYSKKSCITLTPASTVCGQERCRMLAEVSACSAVVVVIHFCTHY
jgi:hypothetical protein